ncbi:MAG: glycosyl transferase [Acidobacteriota bacterium]
MSGWKAAVVAVGSFSVSGAVTYALVRFLLRRGVVDLPNDRSSHTAPTPRGGGLGVLAGIAAGSFVGWCLGLPLLSAPVALGLLLVAAVSAADDYLRGIPLGVRASVHMVAAVLVVFRVGGFEKLPLPPPADLPLGPFGVVVAILWIVGLTNLYNFLDGIDGFAASQGVIAGLAAAFLFPDTAFVTGLAIAGACGGFLLYNWHPARIFLGDVGAASLGFLFASIPFEIQAEGRGRAVFFSALCLWFFLADGLFTLLRRLLRAEKIWRPHRSHLYQRLIATGLRHDQVVRALCGGAAMLAGLAVFGSGRGNASIDWMIFGVAVAAFLAYWATTSAREERVRQSASP